MVRELKVFPGFEPPHENYWQYPKALNGYWSQLNGSEQKVLDYILRHTWGYQKTCDKISLSQFKNGIKKKNGEYFDRGTGIKQDSTILKAIKMLEKIGFIECVQIARKTKFIKLRPLYKLQESSVKNTGVATVKNTDTIYTDTINKLTITASKKLAARPLKRKLDDKSEMSLREFIEWCRKSSQRHINIIGEYADQKQLSDYNTKGQWTSFIKRNLRASRQLSPYTDDQLSKAMKRLNRAKNEQGYIKKWTLETLAKFLDE